MFNPGLKKNGFSNSHDIFWSNIGALDQIKKVLSKYIIEPIRFPDRKMLNYSSGIDYYYMDHLDAEKLYLLMPQ